MMRLVTDLVEFLKARLDEDEQVAQATRRNEQRVPGTEHWFATHSEAIVSMAPHRAVAEVEAKRRIMAWASDPKMNPELIPEAERYYILTALALPYADHPDHDEAWRV